MGSRGGASKGSRLSRDLSDEHSGGAARSEPRAQRLMTRKESEAGVAGAWEVGPRVTRSQCVLLPGAAPLPVSILKLRFSAHRAQGCRKPSCLSVFFCVVSVFWLPRPSSEFTRAGASVCSLIYPQGLGQCLAHSRCLWGWSHTQ